VLKLRVKHRTEMRYAGDAHDSINEVRLSPPSNARQSVRVAQITVHPHAAIHRHIDAFGNEVAWFQVVEPHDTLIVEAEAVVTVTPHPPHPQHVPWHTLDVPTVRDEVGEYLDPSPLVRWPAQVDEFAQDLQLGTIDSIPGWLRATEMGVNRAITYMPGSTDVDTTVEHILKVRSGVCQDMAHLFLALCRRRGIPARYVSGWLYEPGRDRPGESHAWCEAWIPGVGWMEFDPTHPDPDLDRYVRIGVGRDYTDVPPLRGSYLGSPTESMVVTVQIAEESGEDR
jgi:transglutaminase-like putative cysteine protease